MVLADTFQEERDHCIGRLFGSEALIKSQILFTPSASGDNWDSAIDLIFELAKKKAWLREECGWVLFNSLQLLKTVLNGQIFTQIVLKKAHTNDLFRTSEGLSLWIAGQQNFPELALPKHVFHRKDPLHRREKSNLCRILHGTSDGESTASLQKGFWSSRLHFAWGVVFSSVLEDQPKRVSFADLWKEAVDEGLFAASASKERKYWGFLLIQRFILSAPTKTIPTLFQKNFKSCFKIQLASKDRYLHSIADRTLKTLHQRAATSTTSYIAVVSAILEIDLAFDRLTKTKTLEQLLSDADLESLEAVVPLLTNLLTLPPKEGKVQDGSALARAVSDLLVSLVRTRSFPSEGTSELSQYRDIVTAILKCFAHLAYTTSSNPTLIQNELFKERITSCLTHTIAKDSTDPSLLPNSVLSYVRELPDAVPQAEEEISTVLDRGWDTLDKITSREQAASGQVKHMLGALKMLYIFVFLQIFKGDTDAINILEELRNCYKSLRNSKVSDDDDGAGGAMLVEVLLSFVSKPSKLFRRLTSQVFSAYTNAINEQGLLLMINVLEAKEDASGLETLFDREEDGSDVEMIDEDASDVEIDMTAGMSSTEPGGDHFSESESADNDNEEDGKELEAFNAKLAQTLRTQSDESSDDDMNDEQMEALDAQITSVFKHRNGARNKKKEKKDARETMVAFKLRVLELLEIFVKQEATSTRALTIVTPLLQLINSTSNKRISEKACGLIQLFAKIYKLAKAEQTPASESLAPGRMLLQQVHRQAAEGGSNAYAMACSRSNLLATKVILNSGGSIDEVLEMNSASQKLCKIRDVFFENFQNWLTQSRQAPVPASG